MATPNLLLMYRIDGCLLYREGGLNKTAVVFHEWEIGMGE
jgi:hypothetical protein